jgi:hypothetical protein
MTSTKGHCRGRRSFSEQGRAGCRPCSNFRNGRLLQPTRGLRFLCARARGGQRKSNFRRRWDSLSGLSTTCQTRWCWKGTSGCSCALDVKAREAALARLRARVPGDLSRAWYVFEGPYLR